MNKYTQTILLFFALFIGKIAWGQDLPQPSANNLTLTAGSYIIAMDNVSQLNSSNYFNLKAYGLIVYLLNNNVKVKWVIKSGKAKDGIDFTVNATRIKPSSGTATNVDFRAGPFVIQAADISGVATLIDNFNATISSSNDRVKVYQTNTPVTIDQRYDLSGFKPKAILLNNGGNWKIHRQYMFNAGINFGMNLGQTVAANWSLGVAEDLPNGCYTFASEAHWSNSKQAQASTIVNNIKLFLNAGGNVLAQCAAVRTYENAGLLLHSTGGINGVTENKYNGSSSTVAFPNADLSFSQIVGALNINKGGSLKNWTYSGSLLNNQHDHAKGTGICINTGAAAAKFRSSGFGGMLYYIGNHNYDQTNQLDVLNGIRMYLNAFLTPSANNVAICTPPPGGSGGEQCFACPTSPNTINAKTVWTYSATNQTYTIRTTISKTMVDNTYGTNIIGWASPHKFSDLLTGNFLQLALYDGNNTKKMEFKMDYLSASNTVTSGYKSLGVSGGDGAMISGNSSDIVSVKTSLDANLNEFGYVLTTNSPATDGNYTTNTTYPNWNYDVWYEVTVKSSAFGSVGFGTPNIGSITATPSKTGNNVENVSASDCPGNMTVGNQIWADANNDGIKQSTERGLSGLTVKLYADVNGDNIADGTEIMTTVTDAGGNYYFANIKEGKYIVGVVKPTGYGKSGVATTSASPDNDIDNDNNGVVDINGEIRTNFITLLEETEPNDDGDDEFGNLTIDIALVGAATIGDFVWLDRNNNGLQDSGEPGIYNATLNLYEDANGDNVPDGAAIATQLSNNSGGYSFPALIGSKYIVGVVLPEGFIKGVTTLTSSDPNNSTSNDNNGISLTGNELRTNTINLTATTTKVDIALTADCSCTNSTNNALVNGSFENGSAGWIVSGGSLITGTVSLMCGTYNGCLNQSSGTAIITQDVVAGAGSTVNFSGFAGTHTPGLSCNPTLSLIFLNASNVVLQQYNVTVTKDLDINGVALDYYTLSGVAPSGTTKVRVQASIACNTLKMDAFCLTITTPCFTSTTAGPDKVNCNSNTFTMAASAAPSGATGTWSVVGGGANISSINSPISSVTVTSSPATLRWTLTRAGCTAVSADVVLTNTIVTTAIAGPNQTINNTSAVMAANSPAPGETGTWTVVTKPSGSPLVTFGDANSPTTTVNNMNTAGTYTLKWTISKGLCSSSCNVSIAVNNPCIRGSETWPNSWGNNFVTNLTNSTYTGSTGTWTLNTNNNAAFAITAPYYNPSTSNALKLVNWRTDGVSPGKTPAGAGYASALSPATDISNPCCPTGHVMQMTLWTCSVVSGDNNAWMGIDFSNDNGATWTTVFQKTSGQIFADYGANTVTTITIPVSTVFNVSNFRYRFRGESRINNPNNFYMFVDDILFLSPVNCAVLTLGNQVWNDINNNGILDSGEPGVAGVTVDLHNSTGNVVQTTVTDANGFYQFNNLSAGTYSVSAVIPTGYTRGDNGATNIGADNQNDAITTSGGKARTANFTLSASSNTIDIGLKGAMSLGNMVWNDLNVNGLREFGEPGINNVKVNLYQDNNKDNVPDGGIISTTTTSGGGIYSFSNLAPGSYIVGVVFPSKYSSSGVTLSGYSPNNDVDDDNNGVNAVTGGFRSNYITLSSGTEPATFAADGNTNLSLDFALIPDNDIDGNCDCTDIDDDNDGITDLNESGGYDPLADCDGDGIKNYLDPTPGCTTPAGNDPWGVPYKPLTWTDCNNDGINDFFDFDLDGVINEMDLDSDNDGIVDSRESRDPAYLDANMDGMIDGNDPDKNGLLSSAENGNPNPVLNGLQAQDIDRDGQPNFLDLDSDGDGVTDIRESFLTDLNTQYSLLNATNSGTTTGSDIDNDGVRNEVFGGAATDITADQIPAFGAKGIIPIDSDGDGFPNCYDIDSDNDGITDHVEGQPTCSYVLPCTTDADGDGLQDCIETTTIANCTKRIGAGVTPADKDSDGIPDYLDQDTDNDGIPDINEGTGLSGNYVTNFADTDKDGMLDQWDNFNILTAAANFTNNVGHNQMGTNGNTDGPVPSGSTAQLPQSATGTCPNVDRDWRNTQVLPVSLISFNGALESSIAKLSWTTTHETGMRQYEVERSTDGTSYKTMGVVTSQNQTAQYKYTYNDEVSNLTGTKVYYRLRMVNKDLTARYSSVITFTMPARSDMAIHPNPANNSCVISINCRKSQVAPLTIADVSGKIVKLTAIVLVKGMNTINLKELEKLSAGTYIVQIYTDADKLTGHLIIVH